MLKESFNHIAKDIQELTGVLSQGNCPLVAIILDQVWKHIVLSVDPFFLEFRNEKQMMTTEYDSKLQDQKNKLFDAHQNTSKQVLEVKKDLES